MKKLKLRCLTDLPKVSKIIRPGVVTQMQIFKLQIPSKCPLHAHPPITVAGSSLPEESRGTALPRTLKEGQTHQPGSRGSYFNS